MIQLKGEIQLANGTISGINATSGMEKSNISADLSNVVGVQRQGSNPFIFGASKFGDGDTFASSVDYFIGSYGSVEIQGDFETIEIVFDTYNHQHPNSIIIDGTSYPCTNEIFVKDKLGSGSHTIEINNWNNPNYPIRIQGIIVDIDIEINSSTIQSLDITHSDRSDNTKPSWGIISNSGNITFNDPFGKVKVFANAKLLKSDLGVTILIEDTLRNNIRKIGEFTTSKWNYDSSNLEIGVSLKDNLVEWQNIAIDNYELEFDKSMKDMYEYLYSKTPSQYNMLSYAQLDSRTQYVLSNTICKYFYLEKGSLWNGWQKLCEVCALHIYKDNSGNTTCVADYNY